MVNKIIVIGKPIDNYYITRCPWCSTIVYLSQVDYHKENCWHRRPAPTITVVDPEFVVNQPNMQ